jgi:putative peptide zinc metalloprotease protein
MIFYLSPAMFCDVSDAWRLNHLQRARVALAGIMVQIGVSGAAACASGFAGSGQVGDLLVLFSIVNLAASVINTVPFVKLDGYIALMSYLDRPNLRAASMASVRERCVALLTGKPREVREPAWLPWFGIACVSAPVVLVVRGLGNWLDALLSLGYFGYFLSAAVGCFLVIVLFRSVRGFVKALRGAKVRPLRAIGFVVVVGALLTAVAYIPVTTSQNASYAVTADGQVELRIPQGVYDQTVQPGDRVDLVRSGMVLHQSVGTAAVTISPARDEMIPLTALIPVRVDDVKVPGSVYRLTTDATGLPTDGSARLHSRSVPLIRWTYERFLKPFTALFD